MDKTATLERNFTNIEKRRAIEDTRLLPQAWQLRALRAGISFVTISLMLRPPLKRSCSPHKEPQTVVSPEWKVLIHLQDCQECRALKKRQYYCDVGMALVREIPLLRNWWHYDPIVAARAKAYAEAQTQRQ